MVATCTLPEELSILMAHPQELVRGSTGPRPEQWAVVLLRGAVIGAASGVVIWLLRKAMRDML